MFLKNIKYAFRNLKRDKFYTLLNGVGLTTGISVVLLIFMWIQDEKSYDNYHQQNGLNHIVLSNISFGGERMQGVRTPLPLTPAAKNQIPEIQNIARTCGLWKPILKHDNFLLEVENTFLIDPELFNILDFEFLQGDPKSALINPNSIILTERNAFKIFGKENAMGKVLKLNDKMEIIVTGIIKDTPVNTHLPVDCFLPFEKNVEYFYGKGSMNWNSYNFSTYLTLRPNTDPKEINKKLTALLPINEDEPIDERNYFELHPVQDIYMGLSHIKYGFAKGDWGTIRLFGWIGFIILLIASINYINLTTARSAHRAKTTGIKKIIGASRPQIISQHLLEAFSLIGICSLIALLLVQFGLPFFEEISGKELVAKSVFSKNIFLMVGGIALVTVLLSGIQPAWQLSAFRPADVLKGSQFKGVTGKNGLRKVLVVTQFVGSAALIICTIFMLRQMNFIQSAKLGYEKEHVFAFNHTHDNPQLIVESLKGQPGISAVSMSSQSITNINNRLGGFTWEGKEGKEDYSVFSLYAGDEFHDFFNLELKEGRWFYPEKLDSFSCIINETTVKKMNLENPVGTWIDFWGERRTIVGVVKDFHFQSLHNEIQELMFLQSTNWFPTTYVKTTGANTTQAIASAEKIFKQHLPNGIFKYEFLDESYHQLYAKESRVGKLFLFFALVAIIISCLGVFGLATYTAEKRFKEIGIRKVLGASALSIINLLSKDFLKLVFVALIIAIPLAWYFMENWLNNFAFHVNLDWWVFAMAGLIAIGIALATVVFQSARAAMSDPVESIRSE